MRIELRKAPRTSAQSTISYQPVNGNGSGWHQATLLDLGQGGASLRVDQPHGLHETLHLSGLPSTGDERRQGVVRWVRKDGEGYQVGVEFL